MKATYILKDRSLQEVAKVDLECPFKPTQKGISALAKGFFRDHTIEGQDKINCATVIVGKDAYSLTRDEIFPKPQPITQ